ncbi:MAG: DUF1702 family protein [Bacillota bacterium]
MKIVTMILLIIPIIILVLICTYHILIYQNIPRMKNKLNLTNSSNKLYEIRFSAVLQSFLTGHNKASNIFISVNRIRRILDNRFQPFYRGFAYEGTGMGFGFRSLTNPFRSGKIFENYIYKLESRHIYQYYVGLGWCLYILYKFRPKGYNYWIRQMDPYYAPMLFDGVGFKAGLLDYGLRADVIHYFSKLGDNPLRICCQGYGRSLWFLGKFEVDVVLDYLITLPVEVQDDIISGTGLAVAYSFFDQPEKNQEILKKVPSYWRLAFEQGMAFGWETRKLQNHSYWYEVTSSFSPTWVNRMENSVKIVHLARGIAGEEDPESHYTRWMDATRLLMAKNNYHWGE